MHYQRVTKCSPQSARKSCNMTFLTTPRMTLTVLYQTTKKGRRKKTTGCGTTPRVVGTPSLHFFFQTTPPWISSPTIPPNSEPLSLSIFKGCFFEKKSTPNTYHPHPSNPLFETPPLFGTTPSCPLNPAPPWFQTPSLSETTSKVLH